MHEKEENLSLYNKGKIGVAVGILAGSINYIAHVTADAMYGSHYSLEQNMALAVPYGIVAGATTFLFNTDDDRSTVYRKLLLSAAATILLPAGPQIYMMHKFKDDNEKSKTEVPASETHLNNAFGMSLAEATVNKPHRMMFPIARPTQ